MGQEIWPLDRTRFFDYYRQVMNGRILRTTADVIDALGGNQAVQAITGAASRQTVSNWRRFKTFPADTYGDFADALIAINRNAPRSLWRQGQGLISPVMAKAKPREGARRVSVS